MGITDKRRDEILEEERLRMQARADFAREHWGHGHGHWHGHGVCAHRYGHGLFWGLLGLAGILALAHHFAGLM